MDYKKLNEILSQSYLLTNEFSQKPKYLEFTEKLVGHHMDGNESQGDYNEYFTIWKIKDPEFGEGMFIKATVHTDSYGDNEFVKGIEFVKGKSKTVTIYEY